MENGKVTMGKGIVWMGQFKCLDGRRKMIRMGHGKRLDGKREIFGWIKGIVWKGKENCLEGKGKYMKEQGKSFVGKTEAKGKGRKQINRNTD